MITLKNLSSSSSSLFNAEILVPTRVHCRLQMRQAQHLDILIFSAMNMASPSTRHLTEMSAGYSWRFLVWINDVV